MEATLRQSPPPSYIFSAMDQAARREYKLRCLVFKHDKISAAACVESFRQLYFGHRAVMDRLPFLAHRTRPADERASKLELIDDGNDGGPRDLRVKVNPCEEYDRLCPDDLGVRPRRIGLELFKLPTADEDEAQGIPVFTARLTYIKNGVVLGLAFHGSLMDERYIFMVLKTFASGDSCYASGPQDEYTDITEYDFCESDKFSSNEVAQTIEEGCIDASSIITFRADTIRSLTTEVRAALEGGGGNSSSRITAVDCISALLWTSMVGVRWRWATWTYTLPNSRHKSNVRDKLEPPLGGDFFGNAVNSAMTTTKLVNLLPSSNRQTGEISNESVTKIITCAARLIREAVDGVTDQSARARLQLLQRYNVGDNDDVSSRSPQWACRALLRGKDPHGDGVDFVSLADMGGDLRFHMSNQGGNDEGEEVDFDPGKQYQLWSAETDGSFVLLPRRGGSDENAESDWVVQAYIPAVLLQAVRYRLYLWRTEGGFGGPLS
ncbi:hypothetical protein B0H66DRAFT_618752 [Apodospora peruviana]|uniref:Uncharacterized protein n=1 Tax=Apodospora peruviana TaxID=516989 RepID=A0AAE0IB37_9PEZI|nr:hypothetical protein B0H66DRAFT_618752 [Apodospora peruviana]